MSDSEQAAPAMGFWRRLVDWDGSERRRLGLAHDIYVRIVAEARRPHFYARWGVPDTVDGRFEMIGLELMLVIRRLNRIGPEGMALARTLLEVMISDLDRSLRELGVGDLSVGKRVKAMVASYLGRVAAIEPALDAQDPAPIEAALGRNLYLSGKSPEPAQIGALAGHLLAQWRDLVTQPDEAVLEGRFRLLGP